MEWIAGLVAGPIGWAAELVAGMGLFSGPAGAAIGAAGALIKGRLRLVLVAVGAGLVVVTIVALVIANGRQETRTAAAEAKAALAEAAQHRHARDQAEAIARANAAAIEELQRRHAEQLAAAAAETERARKARQQLVVVKQEIRRDPDATARVSPAVRRYLDRLHERRAAAGTGADRRAGNPTRAATPARKPALVRPGAAAAGAGDRDRRGAAGVDRGGARPR